MSPEEYDSLLHGIYDATLDASLWSAFLTDLGRAFHGNVGGVIFIDATRGETTEIIASADRKDSIEDYTRNWAGRSDGAKSGPLLRDNAAASGQPPPDIIRLTFAMQAGGLCTDDMFISSEDLARTTFYHEHLTKFDFHHALGLKLWEGPQSRGVISLSRAAPQGPFQPEELRALGLFRPHLLRAFTISKGLALAEGAPALDRDGLERSGRATFLLNRLGRCVHANVAAEELVRRGNCIKLVQGELQATDPSTNAILAKSIDRAITQDQNGHRVSGAVSIPCPASFAALFLLVSPITLETLRFVPQAPHAIVTIVDPDIRQAPTAEQLRSLFGLTASEAAVAIGIGKGRELKAVAEHLNLTTDSARQYLARVFAKTNTTRQHDLASLLALIRRS